jgi:hypothetical protein
MGPRTRSETFSGKDALSLGDLRMGILSTVLRYEMFFVLTALAATVGYRLLTRQININGLLSDKMSDRPGPGRFSTARLQMLIVTFLIAIYFILEVISTEKMPQLPKEFLMALGGSHSVYLSSKLFGLIGSKLENAATRILKNFQ